LRVPGRINKQDIEALREQADLVAIVSDYTALKRAGGRLKGLCPFHQEKTPSFTVDPARNLYHCFGCNAGGDVYAFLQQAEALSFPEAVERVARRMGHELRYEELSPGQRRTLGRRTRLVEALDAAASFYVEQLATPAGESARAYLVGRGLGDEQLEHFRIGWAPDQWAALARHLMEAGFEAAELIDAGLTSEGKRGPMDRFRGRVMFPIFDSGGRDVVAFGGRVLPGVELRTGGPDAPKYINSAETEVYKKSRVLYGLNWARGEIQRSAETALVVEGYMDVIALHVAGVRNAVATCGTALTAEHFGQLEKFARRVVLALDADEAGFAAAEKARTLAEQVGIREVGVLPLPQGQDPADLAAAGREAVEAALEHTQTAVEFQIGHLLRTADPTTPEGQVAAYRATFPLLARLDDRFLRFTYIRDVVAPAVRLSADVIERELDAHLAARPQPQPPAPAPAEPPPDPGDVARTPRDPQLRLERDVLQAALQLPDLLPDAWDDVAVEDFRAPLSQQLFSALAACPRGDLAAVLDALPTEELRARVRALALAETTLPADPGHVAELVARLRAASVQRQIDDLEEHMATRNEQMAPDERRELVLRHSELVRRRHTLLEGIDA
jgi:DNA primase